MFSNSEQCWRRDLLYDKAVSNNRTAIKMIHGISANERSVSASRESCDSRELSIDENAGVVRHSSPDYPRCKSDFIF